MVISEDDLASYRRAYQVGAIEYHLLPDDLFSWTEDYFWMNGPIEFGVPAADAMTVSVVFAFIDRVPELPFGLTWAALRHQAGGYACEQHRFIATELNVRQVPYRGLCKIARNRWPGGRAGWNGHGNLGNLRGNVRELDAYRSELAELGLQYSGDWLTESLYPIDATQPNLDVLCEGKLTLWELGLSGIEGAATKAAILVIAPNSD